MQGRPAPRAARRAALLAVAACVVLALVAPHVHPPRREVEYLQVEVSPTLRPQAGVPMVLRLRARNVHPQRRRVYTRWVDVSESLGRAGALSLGGVDARWVPLARAWRVPFEDELAPGQSRDVLLRIADPRAGRYEGFVDVVLDGTTWRRTEVAFEVAERSRSGPEANP